MRNRKQFISLLLMLALLLGMVPGTLASALADSIEIEGDLPVEGSEQTPAQADLGSLTLGQTEPVTQESANAGETRKYGYAEDFLPDTLIPPEENVNKLNGKNWMAGIRGDCYLNEFNIPYTHDSAMADYIYHRTSSGGSFFGQQSYAQTQIYYIKGQLNAGVRILDLRLNNEYEVVNALGGCDTKDDKWNLYLCHGKNGFGGTYWAANENGDFLTVHQVLYTIRDFLNAHPTETVVCNFDIENGDSDKIASRLKTILSSVLTQTNPSTGKPYLYTEPGLSSWDQPYTHMPQLKDCRGQVVLIKSTSKFDSIGGMKVTITGYKKSLGGSNDVSSKTKLANLESHAEWLLTQDFGDEPGMLPKPGQHHNKVIVIDTNSHASNNASDYIGSVDKHPLAIAGYVHPRVFGEGKPLSIPGRFYGWIKMDRATPESCKWVYMTNFVTYDDNETITLTVDPGDVDDENYAAHYAVYGTQTYTLPKDSIIPLPENIYDVRDHMALNENPCFDHWEVTTQIATNTYHPGDKVTLNYDTTIRAYYLQEGHETTITADWLDCDDIDQLRPSDLTVKCTIDSDDGEDRYVVTISLTAANGWKEKVRGNVAIVTPVYSKIQTGINDGYGIDAAGNYRYEVVGDRGNLKASDNVSIRLIHTATTENNAKTVSGSVSWEDHENADGIRPQDVTLLLYANGAKIGSTSVNRQTYEGSDKKIYELSSWNWEVPNCPAYKNGKAVEYTVKTLGIDGYTTQINGTDVRFIHEAETTEKTVRVEWKDSDNEAGIRPSYINVGLIVKNGEKVVDEIWREITDYSNVKSIILYGKKYKNFTYKLEPEEIDGYTVVVSPADATADSEFTVTYTLDPIPKRAVLNGVYKAGYKDGSEEVGGDVIAFGDGTFIKNDNPQALMPEMRGNCELIYREYKDGMYHFYIGNQEVAFTAGNYGRPWGIEVNGGKGTEDDPYTFTLLFNEAVGYWEASYDSTSGLVTYEKHSIEVDKSYIITNNTTELKAGEWYVLNDNVTLGKLTVNSGEHVHLILRYGKTLKTTNGFEIPDGATLEIYTEKEGDSRAAINAYYKMSDESFPSWEGAAIGAKPNQKSGTIILHNGTINATSENDTLHVGRAAIGGKAGGGALIVYGGLVNADVKTKMNYTTENAIDGVDVTVYGGMVIAAAVSSKKGNESNDAVAINGSITTGKGISVYDGIHMYEDPDENDLAKEVNGQIERTKEMTIRAGHTHDFVYETDKNEPDTIIATCSAKNCTIDDEIVSLTIMEPELKVYDPKVTAEDDKAKARLPLLDSFVSATHQNITQESIHYYQLSDGDDDLLLSGAPTNAGSYKAVLSLDGVKTHENGQTGKVTATVEYTIAKRPVEISAGSRATITYGESLSAYTAIVGLINNVEKVPGTLEWAEPDTKPDVGIHACTVNFEPKDGDNYEEATCKVTVRVNPAAPNVTKPPKGKELTYTGRDQDLVEPGSVENGTMMYAVGDAAPEKDSGWSNNVPTGRAAGTYKVWYKVLGNDKNYTDLDGYAPIEVTIEKAAPSGEVTANALTYNEKPQALVTPVKEEGGKLQYFVGNAAPTDEKQWEDAIPEKTDADTYTVWYRVKGDGNHKDSASASVKATIAKAPVKVSKPPMADAITYGQTLADSKLTGGTVASEVNPNVAGHFEWVVDATAPTVADSNKTQYDVTFVPANKNYDAGATAVTVVVIPADPTVTPPTAISPLIYSGEAQNIIKAGSATNGTMMYALGKTAPKDKAEWSDSVPTGTEAGDYIVWYKVFGNTNYNDTEAVPLYVTIYPAQSGAVKADSLVYNGEAQKLVVPGTAVGGALQYFLGEAAPTEENQWSADIPTGTDAGAYTVFYRVKGDANHNDSETASVVAKIAKAPIAPTLSITGWTYGEKANAPVLTGNPGKGKVTYLYSDAKDGTFTQTVPTRAGSWFVKAEVAETDNYEGATAAPVSFVIAKVKVSIFADNKSGVYGDALQTLSYRMGEKTVNGDDLGISLTTTAKTDSAPGDYPITVKWSGNANYSATVVDGVYTIGQRPVTVTAKAQTVETDKAIATGVSHATATGLAKRHKLSAVKLTASGASIVASGAKIVDAKGVDVTANYAITYAAGALIIVEPGQFAVFPPEAKKLTYNGKAQKLVTAGNAAGGTMEYSLDKKSWSEKVPTGIKAGTYNVYYRVTGNAAYDDAAQQVVVKIAKAPITPMLSITGWTYGEKANTPVLEGNPGEGQVTFLYSGKKDGKFTDAVPTRAGSWFVKAEVAGTDNYEGATTAPVSFAIAKVNISIFADNQEGVYGDAVRELTYRFGEKTVNGDDLGITLTTKARADSAPGEYPITVKWNGNGNYSAIVKDGVYTILQRPVTVAAKAQTIQEGGKIATGAGKATATGLAEGHRLSAVKLTASGASIVASGAKIVDAKGVDVTANYAITYAAGALIVVVEPGQFAVFPPEAKKLTYNGKAQALVTAGKAVGGTMEYSLDKKSWSKKVPTGIEAGKYNVYYRVTGNAAYDDAAQRVVVKIAKAAPEVTPPKARELTYNGKAQKLVTAGKAEGGTVQYSLDKKSWSKKVPTGIKAGKYNVYYRVKGDKNHTNAAAKRVKVTIARRAADPDYTILAKMTASGSDRLKLSWSEVKGAEGYDVFFKDCDGKQNYTRITITSEHSYTIENLKNRKAYKAEVIAWKKIDGRKKVYIGSASPAVHAITGGYSAGYCNAKSVKLNRSSLSLNVGKSKTLKATVKGVKRGRKVLQHARLVRYYSSDANIAKVMNDGKVIAVGKGSCTIYAITNNGLRASAKVTVK